MIRHLLIPCAMIVLVAAGCDPSPESGDDAGAQCSCTGDSCCCGGMDTECKQGYLCATGGHCKTITQFSFTITVTGTINAKAPKGSAWDSDGLPDPYVKVLRYGSQQCKTPAAKDTLEISASCKLSTITEGTKLSVEVHDEDAAGDTLIFKGGWPTGVPLSAFTGAPSKLSGAVDYTSGGVSVSLKKN